MGSISCRLQRQPEKVEELRKYQNFVVTENEKGERKFIPTEPVAPSIASDFNVVNNALYRGLNRAVNYRLNVDPVDIETQLKKHL